MPRGGRKKGADTHKFDADLVPWLEHMCRVAKRERGWSKFRTIREFVKAEGVLQVLGGKTINATTHRLYQKMRSGRYGKWAFPPGHPLAHWSKYTMRPSDEK